MQETFPPQRGPRQGLPAPCEARQLPRAARVKSSRSAIPKKKRSTTFIEPLMSPLRFITFLAALLLPGLATAQETRPDELVAKITEEVLAAIKSDRELQAADREKALALAQEKILPHIDFKRM